MLACALALVPLLLLYDLGECRSNVCYKPSRVHSSSRTLIIMANAYSYIRSFVARSKRSKWSALIAPNFRLIGLVTAIDNGSGLRHGIS